MLEAPYEAEDAKSRHKNSATKPCPSNRQCWIVLPAGTDFSCNGNHPDLWNDYGLEILV
jgi:hypothetical protein